VTLGILPGGRERILGYVSGDSLRLGQDAEHGNRDGAGAGAEVDDFG
jgi:hypothetical protein